MKKVFVNTICERDRVESSFLVRDKITAMAKNGKPYLTLKLMDKTGEVEGRVWDCVDELSSRFEKNDVVEVQAKASVYLGKMQLVVQDLRKVAEENIDLGDFLPTSEHPAEELVARLHAVVASLQNSHLRDLMGLFLQDADFMHGYRTAPAAKSMHHVYLGGLLEHSLSIAELIDKVAGHYVELDRDLLVVGALMHDVGKVAELSYQRSFDYTDEGKLLGHIIIGVEMLDERIAQLENFPHQLAVHLKHLLLSHHGQYEYGSPKRPKTLEAVVLNFIDDLDSKMNGIRSHIEKEAHREGSWTSYHRLYDRYFFKGESEAANEPAVPPLPDQPVRSAPAVSFDKKRPSSADRNKNLSFSLAEQLQGRSLDLFSNDEDKS